MRGQSSCSRTARTGAISWPTSQDRSVIERGGGLLDVVLVHHQINVMGAFRTGRSTSTGYGRRYARSTRTSSRSRRSTATSLGRNSPISPTGSELPGTASYGIALLSRYPTTSWQVLRLPRIPIRFPMYLTAPRKVLVVHEEPRAVVVGQFETPGGPVAVANTHLSFVPGWSRLRLTRIRRDLAAFNEPVVLMGDFTMTPPRPAAITGYRSLAAHPTFPVEPAGRQLDHIVLRGSIGEEVGSGAPELPLSDHRALFVDLEPTTRR